MTFPFHKGWHARTRPTTGASLVEVMVAVTVLTIGVLGLLSSFGAIQRSIQLSKGKTLASNLAQEQLHIIMQQPYYQVIPSPAPAPTMSGFPYDDSYFTPETVLQGGISYRRLTYIQTVQENSGTLQTLPPETPDTGMRLITVTVLWTEAGQTKNLQLRSVLANPDTVMSNSALTGKVKISGTTTGIPNALVVVAENVGWRDTSNASGDYSISLSPGPGTLVASARGYFTAYVDVTALANASVNTDISMTAMSSGSVTGTAWVHPGPVISQVVASTVQANGFIAQFIELYNPTDEDIVIGGDPPAIRVNFQTAPGCSGAVTCADATYGIKLVYVNTTIEARSYYVIANTTTFTMRGSSVAVDAYYNNGAHSYCSPMPGGAQWNAPSIKQLMLVPHGGSVWLTNASGDILDTVGWAHNANTPPLQEGNYINLGATGLLDSVQIVRASSAAFYSNSYGRAYDSGSNNVDFTTASFVYDVFNVEEGAQTVVAGVPAVGAVISANDGLSNPTTAYATGSPPRAAFALTQVATGTWTVIIASGTAQKQTTNAVTIAATGSTYVYPSSTTFLDEEAVSGFISGRVVDANAVPLNNITMSPGAFGAEVVTNASGRYLLTVSTGIVGVTANADNDNPSYISLSSANISVGLGQIVSGVDFVLSQGGRFSGFVSRDGTNALPGIAVTATDSNDVSRDIQVSDVNGRFTTINIATGTYDITPILDSLESSTPTKVTATVTAGATVSVGTFTVTGALGTIAGNVTAGGIPIATGVLIVVTTKTLAGSPPAAPALSTATLTDSAYYITSSREDGTFSVDVRGSTNPVYRVYGYYYASANGGADSGTSRTATASVLAGQTTSQVNLAW